jgi:hypothetical protein
MPVVSSYSPEPKLHPMPSPGYVWEKTCLALNCLAVGEEPFAERLKNAYASALVRLTPEDAPDRLIGDLKWVLDFAQQHTRSGSITSEADRRKFVEKLLHILTETTLPTIKT